MRHANMQTQRLMRRRNPPFALYAIIFGGLAAVALIYGWGIQAVRAYLLSVNLTTFAAYVYDKRASAKAGVSRIPERVLHGLAALGGTPAAWVAQQSLRHKTVKGSFRLRFWLIAAAQAVLITLAMIYR